MYQSYNSCDSINEFMYKNLCKLYSRYKAALNTALNNTDRIKVSDEKMNEIDSILRNVEKYVISWSFYKNQKLKFDPEFENVIIFKEDIISNI